MKITNRRQDFADFIVRIHGHEIPNAIILSADDEAGEVWTYQTDAAGKPLKPEKGETDPPKELKTGTVVIRKRADEAREAEEAERAAAEQAEREAAIRAEAEAGETES